MANCLYNGTILPALPKNAYPYSAIHLNILSDTEYIAKLVCSTCALTFSDGFISSSLIASEEGTRIVYTAYQGTTEWKQETDGEKNFTAGESVYGFAMGDLKWSNFDILNEDGTLYLAASEPVQITAPVLDPLSLWLGWKAGNWVARQRGKAKQPVAYLYNGVRLPALPEWDKAKYPYVYISNGFSGIGRNYVCFQNIEYGKTDDGSRCIVVPVGTGMSGLYSNDQWKEPTVTTEEKRIAIPNSTMLWANFDVLDEDGTVCLAASEPVPVYE